MHLTCETCSADFTLTQKELDLFRSFEHEPTPICFDCQQKHRMSFRNGRNLYSRTCNKTGEKILTVYAPEKPYKVYSQSAWYGDGWDAIEYGRDFDFSRPFFEQFKELQLEVPRCALLNINPENSDYCNMCAGNKNCYLVFGGDYNEDSLYCTMNMHNRKLIDGDYSNENEGCYWLFNSHHCYGTQFAFDSSNCSNCAFISNCIGCTDCILCTNLKQKTFCIRNEQLTKEQYREQRQSLLDGGYKQQQENIREHEQQRSMRVVKSHYTLSCEDCSGDYITHSKGCKNCFFAWNCEDLVNVILAEKQKDCFHCSYIGGEGGMRNFNQVATINGNECQFSYFTNDSYHSEYSDTAFYCKYVFGCVGLRHKEYCILNKQYTKEAFLVLREKIVAHMKNTGEWGRFFPKHLSCFAYNESTAHEYYPLTKTEALAQGYLWRKEEKEKPKVEKVIPASTLPDDIADIPDDILNWAILCEKSGRPFRIVKAELQFYREMNLPVPHLEHSERFAIRMQLMNPFRLYKRPCAICGKEMKTTYAPERPEKVVCESCYLDTVY
ncbi:hypothetical protein COU76_00960 [Candidatus Peregrinibacteria bacterium CG10_big_fil_rev_8_21_14_0_10_49_10]|nr:MAG: hypothetical protein COU76_00960 [Candidatus Peregrinibacteria bacterium CG10_big_fil_rev_8_21_14_0_10_49_10]